MKTSEFTIKSSAAAFAAWAGFVTGPNTMVSSIAGFFMKPLSESFHLNRTEVSAYTLISPLVVAVFVPIAGRAIDRFGIRRVLIPAIIVFALSQFLAAFARNRVELALAFGVLALAAAFDSSVGYVKVISLWFSRWRGLVLGLCVAMGAGAGSAAMPQVVHYLIEHYDWRTAYMGVGGIILVVGAPIVFFLLHPPSNASVERKATAEAGFTRAEAMRKPNFWFLFFAIFLASMSLIGTVAHAFPMLTERGFPAQTATTALSCVFLGMIFGQLSSGALVDRVDNSRAAMPYFAAAVVGLVIEHTATQTPLLIAGALLAGLGQGGEIALAAYLTGRYFGLRHFASVYSMFFAASNLGIGVGIMAMGICHDLAGDYQPMRWVFGVTMTLSFVLIGLLGPYRFTKHGVPMQAAQPELATA